VYRPEQLVLQDDPSFLPDFALPPPKLLANLNLAIPLVTPQSGESQSLTPFGSQVVPRTPTGSIGGIVLPSSSRDLGDFRLAGDNGPSSVGNTGLFVGENLLEPLAEPDFGFDADGNFFDYTANPVTPKVSRGVMVQSNAGASARVRQEHEEGQMGGAEVSLTADIHCNLRLCFPLCLLFFLLSHHFICRHPSAQSHFVSGSVATAFHFQSRTLSDLPQLLNAYFFICLTASYIILAKIYLLPTTHFFDYVVTPT